MKGVPVLSGIVNGDLNYSKIQLGNFLKYVRVSQGHSLRQLGRLAGISGSHIYRMESAKFDCMLETFIKLTTSLGIPPGWAIDRALGSRPFQFKSAVQESRPVRRLHKLLGANVYGQHAIDSFIQALCSSVAQLLRSGNPLISLSYLSFDHEIIAWLNPLAERFCGSIGFQERGKIIESLTADGLAEIFRLRVCTESQLLNYLRPHIRKTDAWPISGTAEDIAERMLSGQVNIRGIPSWQGGTVGEFMENIGQKKVLEDNGKALEYDSMPSESYTIAHLIERVRSATKPRGSRAELARTLGVLPQQVNDWLQGKNIPGGEATLQLLKWVENEEARTTKQKSNPGRVRPRPGRKAQLRKATTNEKPKSGQRKS